MLRRWSLKLHRWIGLIAGLPIAVVGLTGSLLVYRGALDRLVHPELYRVTPEAAAVTPGEALERVRRRNPDPAPVTVQLPARRDGPYVVWHGASRDAEKTYVDPGTGRVLGVRGAGGGPVRALFALHANLLAGSAGATAVGVLGLLLIAASVTGVVVWWPKAGKLAEAVTVRLAGSSRRVNYDLHRAGGFWTLLYLGVLALTGSGLIFYGTAGDLLERATGSSAPPPAPSSGPAPPGVRTASPPAVPAGRVDSAWNELRRRIPAARITFISLPTSERGPVSLRFRLPAELHPNGRSFAYADRWTGRLMRVDRQPEMDVGPRILHALYPVHIGDFRLGPLSPAAVRALWALLGLSPALLLVTGFVVWYRRGGDGGGRQAPNGDP